MPERSRWTAADLPDLAGKTIAVTGANSGIGYEAALALACAHATVVLACRRLESANAAAEQIRRGAPGAVVEVIELDLASLDSVRACAEAFKHAHRTLDVLVNNAGVMALPYRKTADGFEMQFGTNHLGHFALTGLLLDQLLAADGARVVTVSSTAHRIGKIRFDDLNWEHGYRKWYAYGQSKLANLLFMLELDRKVRRAGIKLTSVACHPGYAATNLQAAGPRMSGAALMEWGTAVANRFFAQSAAMGALPTLYAAAAPEVNGGDYFGPGGFQEMWGSPAKVSCSAAARDEAVAARLWSASEELTQVRYSALGA
jgi:NAD(P)-dependent dehydrogenase (short-subunit alcohol dehydrogenase family)